MLTPAATPIASIAPLVQVLERLEQAHGPPCAEWSQELLDLALDTRAREFDVEARLAVVAARVCELELVADIGEFGLAARLVSRPGHAVDARDFDALQIADLELLAESGAPAGFVARAMDLVWSVLADSHAGRCAVIAYTRLALECAKHAPPRSVSAADAIARAAQITTALGQGSQEFEALSDTVAELLEIARASEDALLLQRCLEIHERIDLGDPEVLAALAMERAEREVAGQRDHRACELFRIAERCLARTTRPAEAAVLVVVRASVLAHAARRCRAQGEPAWISISFLRLALEQLGPAPTALDFRAGLQREIDELSAARAPAARDVDTSSCIARAMHACASRLDRTAPRERPSCVGALAAEPHPERAAPGIDFDRLWAPEHAPAPATNRVLWAAKRDAWVPSARVFASSVLEVARRILAGDPVATREGLARLLENNALVVGDRVSVIERGLSACIEGDALLGLSLLVPHFAEAFDAARVAAPLSPGLRLAAEALFDADGAWALRGKLARGTLASHEYSQEAANLVLWLALRALRDHARAKRPRAVHAAG
jgi:hypothetical protein